MQKYSSNVIEKALKVDNIREVIIRELLDEKKIKEIIGNQYGCYVLRTCASACNSHSKVLLCNCVKSAIAGVNSPKLKPLWKEILDILSR